MFERLRERGFQVEFLSHAEAILSVDFEPAVAELETALLASIVPIEEIVAGSGGESKGTQRLRKALAAAHWPKFAFTIEKRINGIPRESVSHEIDHVRTFSSDARIALEIEWNNKDPFYDRGLENFKHLHADGAISIGVIVTRGRSLHDNMRALVGRFLDERQIQGLADLTAWRYDPTTRQRKGIITRMERRRNPMTFREAFADAFVSDKFGKATTHWRKLEDRVQRGVSNPCPLLLIDLPDTIVTFHEREAALAEVDAVLNADAAEAGGA